jgi:hypothetical protein
VRFKKQEKHMVISTHYYEIPDSEIASRFGSAERFTEILSHLGEDGLGSGSGQPPTDEETDALNDITAEYGSIDRDDYWITEESGGAETTYEADGESN